MEGSKLTRRQLIGLGVVGAASAAIPLHKEIIDGLGNIIRDDTPIGTDINTPTTYSGVTSTSIITNTSTPELTGTQTSFPTIETTNAPSFTNTVEPTHTFTNTPTSIPTEMPTNTPEPSKTPTSTETPHPISTPTPTETPLQIPTEEPTVMMTETPEKKVSNEESLLDRFKTADADMELMSEIVKESKKIVQNFKGTEYEYGWCLKGVQDALVQVGLEIYQEDEEGNILRYNDGSLVRPWSAYEMINLLYEDPRFVNIDISKDELPLLPPGAIVVWEGDPNNSADDGTDSSGNFVDHGHIEISWGNGVRASSYINDGSEIPFFQLDSTFYVFAPLNEERNIERAYDIALVGFNSDQRLAAWNKLYEVESSNLKDLVSGTKVTAIPGTGSEQIDKNNINFGKDISTEYYPLILLHELGHVIYNRYIDILEPLMADIVENEGFLTEYGRIGYEEKFNQGKNFGLYHELFADLITNYLNPKNTTATNKFSLKQINYLYTKPDKYILYRQLAQDILYGNLLIKN